MHVVGRLRLTLAFRHIFTKTRSGFDTWRIVFAVQTFLSFDKDAELGDRFISNNDRQYKNSPSVVNWQVGRVAGLENQGLAKTAGSLNTCLFDAFGPLHFQNTI